jgi:hypothetical protein
VLSGPKLEKELAKIGDDTLKELLSETERKTLDEIVTVAKAIRSSESRGAAAFTSITPQGSNIQAALSVPGAALGAAVGGGMPGAIAGGALSYMLTPAVIAKLLTNPKTAAAIASGTQSLRGRSVQELSQLAGRGILKAEEGAQDRYDTGLRLGIQP